MDLVSLFVKRIGNNETDCMDFVRVSHWQQTQQLTVGLELCTCVTLATDTAAYCGLGEQCWETRIVLTKVQTQFVIRRNIHDKF
jgi:hypothetical protein